MKSPPMRQQHKLKLERRISSHVLRTFLTNILLLFSKKSSMAPTLHNAFCPSKVTTPRKQRAPKAANSESNKGRHVLNFTVRSWQYFLTYNADWYKAMEKLGWNGKGKSARLQQRMAGAFLWGGRRGWVGESKTGSKRRETRAIWWRGSWIRFQTQNISRILQLQEYAKNIFHRDWWNEKCPD